VSILHRGMMPFMGKRMKRQKQQSFNNAFYMLYGSIFCCALLLVACSGTPPPPKHPLSASETQTAGTQTPSSTSVSPGHSSFSITVVNSGTQISSYPGGQMSLTVSTSPFAVCSFSVNYGRSTPSTSSGIVPHTANAHGMVSWTWHVDSNAHTGSSPLTITAVLPDGQKTSTVVNAQVTFPPVSLVSSQSILRAAPKGTMSLDIFTAPDVLAVLDLNYEPGKPVKYLRSTSDSSGIAHWSWTVDASASPGTWPLTIVVTLADGEQTSNQVEITVL
jgi:hypothetical protein